MARIKYSAIISEASGKLNGSVFSRDKNGAILRNKQVKVNKRSALQQKTRSINKLLSTAWRNLTIAQRLSWENYAHRYYSSTITKKSSMLTGRMLFMKINYYCVRAGKDVLSNIPSDQPLSNVFDFSVENELDGTKVILDRSVDSDNDLVFISASYILPNSVESLNQRTKIIHADTTDSVTIDITDGYYDAFGLKLDGVFYLMFAVHIINIKSGAISLKRKKLVNLHSPYLLDMISTDCAQAYAPIRLSSSYTDACLQVYRDSDGATLDVGFSSGVIDFDSIFSFLDGGSGHISAIYDQSGNGAHILFNQSGTMPVFVDDEYMLMDSISPVTYSNGLNRSTSDDFSNFVKLSVVNNYAYPFKHSAPPFLINQLVIRPDASPNANVSSFYGSGSEYEYACTDIRHKEVISQQVTNGVERIEQNGSTLNINTVGNFTWVNDQMFDPGDGVWHLYFMLSFNGVPDNDERDLINNLEM